MTSEVQTFYGDDKGQQLRFLKNLFKLSNSLHDTFML